MFKNQKIRFRILLGYSVPLLLFVLVALAIFLSIRSYEKAHLQTKHSISVVNMSHEVFLNVSGLQRSGRGYLLIKNDESRNNYNMTKNELEKSSQSLNSFIKDEKQQVVFGKIMGKNRRLVDAYDDLLALVDKGEYDKAMESFRRGELIGLSTDFNELSGEFDRRETELMENAEREEKAALGNIGTSLIIGVFSTLLLSGVFGFWVANSIMGPVSSAVNAMSSTSTEIAATVNQHERTATQQAAMVNETTTTIQELGASSKQTSEQASSAAEVAQRSLGATGEGMAMVKQAMDGMTNLGDKVGIIADQILKLGEQTAQIGNLANMVKDLSGEINMLALNAAVEAARAGEHGKGFAVVAGEVRKLANESKKSAEQANAVIADIQKATNATILRTEEGTKVVEEVTTYARNVGELFKSLSEAANSSYENAQQVLLNAKQQATAIAQVVEAMNGLNTGARDTAAGIVQTKTGIEQLNIAAGNLKQIL